VIVSTEDVFRAFDLGAVKERPDTQRIIHGIANRDLTEICAGMANVLESVTAIQYPIVSELKDFLMEKGAVKTMMTGSGPTVFGIFDGRKAAEEATKAAKKAYRGYSDIFMTRPISY